MPHFDERIRGDRLAEQMELKMDMIQSNITIHGVDSNRISDGYHTFSELYEQRHRLWITLCRKISVHEPGHFVWKSKLHSDGSCFEGWFILGIHAAGPQLTFHLPLYYWDEVDFCQPLDQAPKWDGHSSFDVLERLKTL